MALISDASVGIETEMLV